MDTQNQNFKQQIENTAENKMTFNTWLIVILVGVVVGIAIAYAIFTKTSLAPTDSDTATTTVETTTDKKTEVKSTTSTSVMTTDKMSIVVSDQVPGTKVAIDSLDLSNPAWVVTFNSTEDNTKPFKIIGAQYFDQGVYTKVNAFIAEGITAGNTYFVALYKDDGLTGTSTPAGHIFNYATDKPFTDKTGAWIMDSFKALSTSSRG